MIRADPTSGYRPYLLFPKIPNNDPVTLFLLAFSSGGRAQTSDKDDRLARAGFLKKRRSLRWIKARAARPGRAGIEYF
jgi:hypothetical protein